MADSKITNYPEISEKDIDAHIIILTEFAKRNNGFKLNPNEATVRALVKGLLNNEKKYGLKFCPCRIRTKNKEKDIKLICPCNFKSQQNWQDKEECWCGLFVKNWT